MTWAVWAPNQPHNQKERKKKRHNMRENFSINNNMKIKMVKTDKEMNQKQNSRRLRPSNEAACVHYRGRVQSIHNYTYITWTCRVCGVPYWIEIFIFNFVNAPFFSNNILYWLYNSIGEMPTSLCSFPHFSNSSPVHRHFYRKKFKLQNCEISSFQEIVKFNIGGSAAHRHILLVRLLLLGSFALWSLGSRKIIRIRCVRIAFKAPNVICVAGV